MARLHTQWNLQRSRSTSDTGSALAVSLWKLAGESLLSLENEGFETSSRAQRLDVMVEFLAYELHVLDRVAYNHLSSDRRSKLIKATADKLIDIVSDNREDVQAGNNHSTEFVNLLNTRSAEYADCGFHPDGPGFTLRRLLGGFVQKVMGEKDRKWVPEYVQDIEAPKLYTQLNRAAKAMF